MRPRFRTALVCLTVAGALGGGTVAYAASGSSTTTTTTPSSTTQNSGSTTTPNPSQLEGQGSGQSRGRRRAAAGRGTTTVPACRHGEECDAATGSRREPHSARRRPDRPRRLWCRHGPALLEPRTRPDRRGAERPLRPTGQRLRPRARHAVGPRARPQRPRVGHDLGRRPATARRRLPDRRGRRHPGEGDLWPEGPTRPRLARRHALRRLDRAGRRLQRPDGTRFQTRRQDPEGAGWPRLEQTSCWRPTAVW